MPRRKQTQPMQRKNSEEGKDNEELPSEASDTDDQLSKGLATELPGVEGSTTNTSAYFTTRYLSPSPDRDEEDPTTGGVALSEGNTSSREDLGEKSGEREACLMPNEEEFDEPLPSPVCSLSPDTVKGENCEEHYPDTPEEPSQMEGGKDTVNLSRVKRERMNELKESDSNSCAASGDENSRDGESSCPDITNVSSCTPEMHQSSVVGVSRSMEQATGAPAASPPFALKTSPGSTRQSSVKQLESFVASVECQSPSRPKIVEKKSPSIVQMPVAALSRKCKSLRMKTHPVNSPPKIPKQSHESNCHFIIPPSTTDPNQPLDLSVKTRQKDAHPGETKYLSYPCVSDIVGSVTGAAGSSLADLEKKFGNTSAIFDRIGTKTWASPFCGALVSRLGVNLYNSKLHGSFADSPSAFGIGMIPVPVQRFNSTQANPMKPDAAVVVAAASAAKQEQAEQVSDADAGCRAVEPGFHWQQKHPVDASSDQRKHTNFQCSCGAELETLYHLTMHLQQTGHAPNKLKNVGRQEYSKLVRGQDMWLNHGCEQTRQILRCMECDESFKSLPELTVHMIQTKHYANIVGADTLQRKAPSKNSESRSEPSSEGSEANRVNCAVCLEVFDDAESLGSHILEAGHYKSGQERSEGVMVQEEARIKRSSRSRSLTPIDPVSPQSCTEDVSLVDAVREETEKERKRNHSLSESSSFEDFKNAESVKRCRSARYSDSEDDQIKGCHRQKLTDRVQHEHPSSEKSVEPAAEAGKHHTLPNPKERIDMVPVSPGDDESLPQSCDNSRYKQQFHQQHSARSDTERSSRAGKEIMETVNQAAAAFHMENFFRPSSTSSSDGSAIRAMETFIKNSFGSAEMKQRSPVLHQMANTDSSSLVGSLISRFGSYMDSLKMEGERVTGRQESRSSDSLDNSNLYQNKYLPPVYIAPVPNGQTDNNRWSSGRKLTTEIADVTSNREPGRQNTSENQCKEPEKLERPPSIEHQNKTKWSLKRVERDTSPEQHSRKSDDSGTGDSFNRDFLFGRSIDLKALERTKGGLDIGERDTDERPSSTSNNPARSSALESLQGLVYGKTLNSEHPLDSLQKLIYGRGSSAVVNAGGQSSGNGNLMNGANGSHTAVIMKGPEALNHPLPPGTLILVNPIVTVVPGASGSNPSLNITLSGCDSSPVTAPPSAGVDAENAKRSEPTGSRRLQSPLDDRENSLRIYRCRGCRRKFSSKGSYRYHLSRCHVLTSSSSSSSDKCSLVKDSLTKSPYICLPLDATVKFNKYYKLASELGTEAK